MRILTLSILAITTLFLASCSKKNKGDDPIICIEPYQSFTKLEGTWEYRKAIGGICGVCEFNYPAGNGKYYKFTDSTYELYTNNQLSTKGRYRIFKDSSDYFKRIEDRIIFENLNEGFKTFITIEETKISFRPEYPDYQIAVYMRPGTNIQ